MINPIKLHFWGTNSIFRALWTLAKTIHLPVVKYTFKVSRNFINLFPYASALILVRLASNLFIRYPPCPKKLLPSVIQQKIGYTLFLVIICLYLPTALTQVWPQVPTDSVFFFANISISDSITIIPDLFSAIGLYSDNVNLTHICPQSTYLIFKCKFYDQTNDPPVITNHFLTAYELQVLLIFFFQPKVWFRYVNDIFVNWSLCVQDLIANIKQITYSFHQTFV